MTRPITRAEFARTRQLAPAPHLAPVALPNIRRELETRHFDLPVSLHAGFFGLFLAYLGIMFLGFQSPGLIIPMAIFIVFTVGFYVLPALWAGMKPHHVDTPLGLAALMQQGLMTHTGWCRGKDVASQVMLMPVVLVGWGLTVVTIAALV